MIARARGPAVACIVAFACAPVPAERAPTTAPVAAPAPPCAADGADGIAACVDAGRWSAAVDRIVGARPPGSTHHREVQALCGDTFAELGYAVELERFASGVNTKGVNTKGVNVVGTLAGRTNDRVVVGAHYDHIPGCSGADDNASGVAGVLELARVLARHEFERTLVLICLDDEESGLLGSRAWVQQHRAEAPIAVAFVFDAIGVRRSEPGTQTVPAGFEILFPAEVERLREREHRGDFVAVIVDSTARAHADRLAAAAASLDLPTSVLALDRLWLHVPVAIDLRRSDHAAFWDAGVPALLVTDTAEFRTPTYHCKGAPDETDSLDPAFARAVVAATGHAIVHALNDGALKHEKE